MFTKIKITYELQDLTDLFEIHPETGVITTKKEFDREKKESYNVKVIAKDGAPSAILNNGEPNTGMLFFFAFFSVGFILPECCNMRKIIFHYIHLIMVFCCSRNSK